MRKLIIGCPIRNDIDSFKAMYESLLNSTDFPFQFAMAIGAGTTDENIRYLTDLPKKKGVSVIIINDPWKDGTKTPLDAYNRLFDYARDNECDLLLTQTDVIFPKLYKRDWLEQFYKISQLEHVGAVTTINGGGMSGPRWINGFKWVGAWCTYFPYNTILSIGNFDDKYLIGDGVDIDYSYRIYLAGLHVATTNYWVDHHMMNARSDEGKYTHEQLENMKRLNGEYFRKKFGLTLSPYYKKEINELKEEIDK